LCRISDVDRFEPEAGTRAHYLGVSVALWQLAQRGRMT
jgi:hypothetical protein